VVELANGHVGSDILSHRDDGDSDDGERLVQIVVFLGVEVVVAVSEHLLNLEYAARAGEGANVDEDERLLADGSLDGLERLDGRIRSILPSCRPSEGSARTLRRSRTPQNVPRNSSANPRLRKRPHLLLSSASSRSIIV
jgi:hypothetical protein